jgi:hypothetical protein
MAPGYWLSPIVIPNHDGEEQEGQEMDVAESSDDEELEGSVTSMESIEPLHATVPDSSNQGIDSVHDELAADESSDGATDMSFLEAVHIQANYIHARDVSEEHRELLRESIEKHGVISDWILRTY